MLKISLYTSPMMPGSGSRWLRLIFSLSPFCLSSDGVAPAVDEVALVVRSDLVPRPAACGVSDVHHAAELVPAEQAESPGDTVEQDAGDTDAGRSCHPGTESLSGRYRVTCRRMSSSMLTSRRPVPRVPTG